MASSVWSALEGNTGMSSVADPAAMLNNQLASALSTMGDAQFWEESISPSTIQQSLSEADPSNPAHTHSLLRGMKWLLASISKGRDVSDFYSHVVKLVGSVSLEVRKMVYMYLVQYADHDATTRELSLLSINSFQRGLADAEQLIRALALRVLTSIRIADVLQIQILGVQKCAKDRSPYVRKCAANALSKLNPRCSREQREILIEIMKELLDTDVCTMVLTSLAVAFTEICPDRLELLHQSFRKICHLLTDMDEWGQVVVIDVMARYCRKFFREPAGWKDGSAERIDRERRVRRTVQGIAAPTSSTTISSDDEPSSAVPTSAADTAAQQGVTLPPRQHVPRKIKRRVVRKGFYSDEEDESTEEEVFAENLNGPTLPVSTAFRQHSIVGISEAPGSNAQMDMDEDAELAEDHRLLLRSAMPLLKSRNAGVVLAVCSLQYYCGISSIKVRSAMGKALVRIHRDRREIQYVVLSSIRTLASECPSAFTPFLHDFYVNAMDPPFTRLIKLDILTSLALEPAAIESVLKELRTYVRHGDTSFVCAAIRAVGRVTELARIVFDRHGARSGNSIKERAEANRIALNCLHGLLMLTSTSDSPIVVGESVTAMQRIVQMLVSDAKDHGEIMRVHDPNKIQDRAVRRIILLLIRTLSSRINQDETDNNDDGDDDEEPPPSDKVGVTLPTAATASALWLIGELFSPQPIAAVAAAGDLSDSFKSNMRAELLRLLARAFLELEPEEKEQAVHFASKMVLCKAAGDNVGPDHVSLCEHLLCLGRLDLDINVRDRARQESSLIRATVGLQYETDALENVPSFKKALNIEHAKRILLTTKPPSSSLPVEEKMSTNVDGKAGFRFGTLSSIVGHKARSAYLSLPPWAEKDSPSSLREPAKEGDKSSNAKAAASANAGTFYKSSSSSSEEEEEEEDTSDSESSSDESSNSSESATSSSSSADDSTSGSEDPGLAGKVAKNISQAQRRQIIPTLHTNGPTRPIGVKVEDASDSDDSSSDASSSSSSSSDESSRAHYGNGVGELIPISGDHVNSSNTNGSSSISDDLKGLVIAPVRLQPQDVNADRDSSGWMVLVRPEHAGGLQVKIRYLRGYTLTHQAQLLGLAATQPTVICLQLCIENTRHDTVFRRIRVLQKASASSSSSIIGPRKVILPPEIAQLSGGESRECVLGIEFAGISDRDGSLLAKLEIKSSNGSIPVDIQPSVGIMLRPSKVLSVDDFDAAIHRLQGFQRVESKVSGGSLLDTLLSLAALTLIGDNGEKDGKLRLAGTLPASNDPIYVQVTNTTGSESKLIVCCDHPLAASSMMNLLKKAL